MKSVIANEKITAKQVRLVDGDSSNIVSLSVALDKAESKGLDLIQISDADVPVVKIMDLNKFNYDNKQAEKEAKKKQRQNTTQVKEIQFTFETQEHDLAVKAKSAAKFLSEGKQVRIVMKIQGRQVTNQTMVERHKEVLQQFISRLGEVEHVQQIAAQGKYVTCAVKSK